MKFVLNQNRKNIPELELLDDLRRVSAALGEKRFSKEAYLKLGKFHPSTIERRFGNFYAALEKVSIVPNRVQLNIPNEELFENLAEVWIKLGKQPTYNIMRKPQSKFSAGTYENRFGTWNNALEAFIGYIEGNSLGSNDFAHNPSAISTKNRTPRNINWRLRASILIRDNCICKMCGASPAKDSVVQLHVDHILPYSKGGETVESNLRTLCHVCNIGRSNQFME